MERIYASVDTTALGLLKKEEEEEEYKKKNKKKKWRFLTSRGAYVKLRYIAILSFDWKSAENRCGV